MKLTETQIQYIKENYRVIGRYDIAKKFGCSNYVVYKVAKKFGIKFDRSKEYDSRCNKQNVVQFVKDFTPESAYILGFLWADGNITRSSRSYIIAMSVQVNDGIYLENIFQKTSKWTLYKYGPTVNTRNNGSKFWFNLINKELFQFLENHDYKIKSGASADKILVKLPQYLHPYWFMGYFDGDGHLGIRKYSYSVIFTSCHQQNWNFLEKILQKLSITYKIVRIIQKNGHKCSRLNIYNISNLCKLYEYMYQDDIGLPRKWDKFNEFYASKRIKYLSKSIDN